MRTLVRVVALALSLLAALPAAAGALTLDPVAPAGTYTNPIFVTSDPANPDRLFIVERAGLIKVTEGASTSVFADLSSYISCCGGERGLLSMAIPPDYPETGRVFVAYTEPGGDLTVAKLHSAGGSAPAQVPQVLLSVEHSTYSNHNGGQIQWGPDGYLYASVGDGGSGDDPFDSGQSTTTLLGKLLRIDPATGAPAPGNPFGNEIWSYGLRNPWRFSFDRLTGDLLLGDVGQGAREEIDLAPAVAGRGKGVNFGWDCREGLIAHAPTSAQSPACAGRAGFTDPIFDYPHSDPGGGAAHGCSITGGYVVRDPTLTGLTGRYLYADYCAGDLRSVTPTLPRTTDDRAEGLNVPNPTSFGEDACGRIYVASNGGPVSRLANGSPAPCPTLSVQVEGMYGHVTGTGISCPGDCHESLSSGGQITLQAVGEVTIGVHLEAWGGACAGVNPDAPCRVDLSQDQTVTARFSTPDKSFPDTEPTDVTLRPNHRRVGSGMRTVLTAHVKLCVRDRKRRVILRRDGEAFGSKPIPKDCTVKFRPRITRPHRFRAVVPAKGYERRGSSALVHIHMRPAH